MPAREHPHGGDAVCGGLIGLPPPGTSRRLAVLACVVVFFHVLNSVLQERVFNIPEFHHTVALSALQSVFIAFFAWIQLMWDHRSAPPASPAARGQTPEMTAGNVVVHCKESHVSDLGGTCNGDNTPGSGRGLETQALRPLTDLQSLSMPQGTPSHDGIVHRRLVEESGVRVLPHSAQGDSAGACIPSHVLSLSGAVLAPLSGTTTAAHEHNGFPPHSVEYTNGVLRPLVGPGYSKHAAGNVSQPCNSPAWLGDVAPVQSPSAPSSSSSSSPSDFLPCLSEQHRQRSCAQKIRFMIYELRRRAGLLEQRVANFSRWLVAPRWLVERGGSLLPPRRCPLGVYFLISLLNTSSTVLTNQASLWLNYTTQVIFKSSKLLFIVVVRFLLIDVPASFSGMVSSDPSSLQGHAGTWTTSSLASKVALTSLVVVAVAGMTAAATLSPADAKGPSLGAVIGTDQKPKKAHRTAIRKLAEEVMSSTLIVGGLVLFTYATSMSKMAHKKTVGGTKSTIGPERTVFVPSTSAGPMVPRVLAEEDVSFLWKLVGDEEMRPILGVVAIVVALVFDAFINVFQEKYCFMRFRASSTEVLFYVYGFAGCNALNTLLFLSPMQPIDGLTYLAPVTAERRWGAHQPVGSEHLAPLEAEHITALRDVLLFARANVDFPLSVFFASFFSFCGSTVLLRIISEYSSGCAVVVTSTRKVLTILCSYLIYPKPFGVWHGVSILWIVIGVFWFEEVRRTSSKK